MSKNGAQPIDQETNLANKIAVQRFMARIADATMSNVGSTLKDAYHSDAIWRGSHPMNEVIGPEAIATIAWTPLLHSFTDLERRDEILVGGRYKDKHGAIKDLVACMGHYCGTFKNDWLGIPATGQPIWLRYGEVHEVRDGKIERSSCLWDVLDVIRQVGFWPIAPSWGAEGRWMGPITCDGLIFTKQDMDEGLASIAQTLAMHKTLADYNDRAMQGREGLINMPSERTLA